MPAPVPYWLSQDFCREHGQKGAAALSREFDGSPSTWRDRRANMSRLFPALVPLKDTQGRTVGDTTPDPSAMVKFLSRGRTEAEIAAKGYTLDEARSVPNCDLFETRNQYQELVYLLLPKIATVPLQPKIWSHRWATDTDGTPQPYLMVQMPDTAWDKVKIVPLADVHYGASAAMVTKFREYVNYVATNDNVFACICGDLLENAHGDSCKGVAVYEQDVRPASQVEEMCALLAPIAHKILLAIPGNHEDRSRIRDYDPLERICERLEIPYSYEPVDVDVCWKGTPFSFHAKHGNTSSNTKGGKMNAAARPQKFHEHVMFTLMAHVHDGDVARNTRICRDRVNFRLEFRKEYVVICPSFYGYFGSYASKAGYEPGSYGSINMDLFANGDYHANS